MAENNVRMSPVQSRNDGQRRNKDSRVQTNRATAVATGLTPTASRVNSYQGTVARKEDSRAADLARALGAMSPALNSLADTVQQKTDNDYLNSAEYHMTRIREELGTGVVTAVQAGEMLPEASHTVVAKITQAMGNKFAKDFFAPVAEAIQSDDNLRLNTAARNEFLAEKRAEALASTTDPFYLSGITSGLDAQVNQYEQRWLMETAEYQKGIVRETTKENIANMLVGGADENAWKAWDDVEKNSSPFINTERNALVVETAINTAIEMEDPNLLDNVPDTFLNAQAKRDLAQAKQNIRNATFQQFTQARTLEDFKRSEDIRNLKIQGLREHVTNGSVRLSNYIDNPEVYTFLSGLAKTPLVDSYASASNLGRARNSFMTAAFTGDTSRLGSFKGELSYDSALNHIAHMQGMNVVDKEALIKELPKLLQATSILEEPVVSREMSNWIRPRLDALRSSPNAEYQEVLNGLNVETRVMQIYEGDLQGMVMDHYRETNELPIGTTLTGYVAQARDNALRLADELAKIASMNLTPEQARSQLEDKGEVKSTTTPEMVKFKDPVTGEWTYGPAESGN